VIEFKNVNVSFKNGDKEFSAVKDASLKIEKGEIFGIVGSSGAGKSTLLRTINLLQPVTSGDVLVNGESIVGYKSEKLRNLRRNTGMIFQHFNLADNKTVYQNIAFVLKAAGKSKADTDKRVKELLELVNLTEKSDSYPSRLSGGQKQRVAIARALANNAEILLCDEATSALDLETTASILTLLKELNQRLGITIVIITHELDVVKSICSRVAVMNSGEIVETGGVYDIFTKSENEFTKQLISHTLKFDLPDEVLANIKGTVVKITYHGDNANNPILSYAANTCGVGFNILLGKIEYINKVPLGILYVNIFGEAESIKSALQYLASHTESTEVIYDENKSF